MLGCLPVLVLLLQVGAGSAAEPPARPTTRPALVLPGLKALSQEITALRRSADYRGTLSYGRRNRPVPVLHLGEALLAAPRIAELAPGTEGSLKLDGKNYRVRFLGSDDRFADYWILRDRGHIDAPPSPRFHEPKLREELGDLVLVLEDRAAHLDLLADWQFRMPPMRGAGRQRGGLSDWRSGVFTRISDEGVQEGAAVLALDGSLVGMVLPLDFGGSSRRRSMRPTQGSSTGQDEEQPKQGDVTTGAQGEPGGGQQGARRGPEQAGEATGGAGTRIQLGGAPQGREGGGAQRTVSPFLLVVDPRFLLSQARTLMDKELPAASPSLGIRLLPASRDGSEEGLEVLELWEGGPCQRAGARPGDRWLALDGKSLSRLDQIRAALENLGPSGQIEIRFRRGETEPAVLVIRPD